MKIHTYIVSNNKTRHAAILQTKRHRSELWLELQEDVDAILEKEDHAQAISLLTEEGFEIVPYDYFLK